MDEIECSSCGGTGRVLVEVDTTKTMYGEYEIGKDWKKIENAWIWFNAFNRPPNWCGIFGFVYEKPDGTFTAPFRGELVDVTHDYKNEYRELTTKATQPLRKDK